MFTLTLFDIKQQLLRGIGSRAVMLQMSRYLFLAPSARVTPWALGRFKTDFYSYMVDIIQQDLSKAICGDSTRLYCRLRGFL